MAEYTVLLNDDAEEGLKKGIYEFTTGGIRNVKTKTIVQLFRPTGKKVEEQVDGPCVQMAVGLGIEQSSKLMRRADYVLAAVKECKELAWEASVIGYLNYNVSIQGFAETARKIDILQNTIEYNRLQDKKENYAKHYMNLKDLLSYLSEEDPEIPIYEISKTLSEITAFINGIYEEYSHGRIQSDIALRMIISLVVPFVRCAEECCLFCQQKGKETPPSYNEWMSIVEKIMASELLVKDLRRMVYVNLPVRSTYDLEIAASFPYKTVEYIRIEARRIRAFISESGMSRKEYLSFPKEMERNFILGNYSKGELINEKAFF